MTLGSVGNMAYLAREVADHMMDLDPNDCVSTETFTKESREKAAHASTSSSYVLADDHSQFSRELDHWMNGSVATTESAGIQGSRVPVVQRSVLARRSSLENSGLWYMLAMVLPLFSINTCPHWRCTPSLVFHTAEIFMTHFSRVCSSARAHFRQLAQDQVARELFATAMDIVLVIYAIGFLILSMYQASIFG